MPQSIEISGFRVLAIASAITLFILGGLVLAGGWGLGLTDVRSAGGVAMAPFTAVALALCGVGIIALITPPRKSTKKILYGVATVLALLGATFLTEYAADVSLGIDSLLFQSAVRAAGGPYPGRPSPNAALCMLLLGLSLLAAGQSNRRLRIAGEGCAGIATFIALQAVLGYVYGVTALYQMGTFRPLALHTAAGVIVAAFGVLAAQSRTGIAAYMAANNLTGFMARRLVPAVLLVPMLVGLVILMMQRSGWLNQHSGMPITILSLIVVAGILIAFALRQLAASEMRADRSAQLLLAVLDSTADAVTAKDRNGAYQFVNKQAEGLMGSSAAALLGKNDSQLLDPKAVVRALSLDAEALRAGRSIVAEETMGTPDRHFQVTRTPMRSTDGSVAGIVTTARDITERKAVLEELRHAIDAARSANQAKDEFLASMSHELRTPLTAIIGYADIMAEGIDQQLHPAHRQRIEGILRSSWRLANLIDRLITMVKLGEPGLTPDLELVHVDQIMQLLIDQHGAAACEKGLELRIESSAEEPHLETDRDLLIQLLDLLVDNAIRFTDEGAVTISVESSDPFLLIRVRDTGRGITEAERDRIFQAFTQADQSHMRRHGGMGTGLAIASRIARILEAQLTVQSRPQIGSEFTVRLPCGDLRPTHPDASLSLTHKRVLVVDDEDAVRAIMSRLVRRKGALVMDAASATEALAIFADFSPDLIVTDVSMPGASGLELARHIRALNADQRIILVSGAELSEQDYAMAHTVSNAFLAKPFDAGAFLGMITALLSEPVVSDR